jgi:predicted nucleotidyltransferase component of viral defense system
MAFSEAYRKQVALVMRVLPFIAEEDCFALKGGTAINFFIRNMPRLSVDIDLTYLPVAPRPESLAAIDAALKRIENRIKEGTVSSISTRQVNRQLNLDKTSKKKRAALVEELEAVLNRGSVR